MFSLWELSNKIYENVGFSKKLSLKLIDDFFENMVLELVKLKSIKISSFGTFEVIKKNERIGRNPKTKAIAKISARKIVKFRPSIDFKNRINKYEKKS